MRTVRLVTLALLALYAGAGVRATAEESLFDAPSLDDEQLAEARGGFSLANGVTIDFGVVVSTVVDGTRVLQTELRVLGDSVTTSVLQATGTQAPNNAGSLDVPIVDATGGSGSGSSPGSGSGSGVADGKTPTPAVTSYVVTTNTGALGGGKGVTATAVLPQLMIEHQIGDSISSVIVNTGDGRVIDSSLTIDLTIGNVQPYSIGSAGYRIQSLGLDAALWRGSGG